MQAYEPTAEQIAAFTPVMAQYMQKFATLPDEVKGKMMAEKASDEGKALHETIDHIEAVKLFDAADANGDGVLDRDEYLIFEKSIFAFRDAKYGGHVEVEGDLHKQWIDLLMGISAPTDSMTKDDLNKLSYISSTCVKKMMAA